MDVFLCRFHASMKDLEMLMRNLINAVFKTVYTIEEGVRLLDIFRPMATREVSFRNTHTHTHTMHYSSTIF